MSNKMIGLWVVFTLVIACKENPKNGAHIESETPVEVTLTDGHGNTLSKAELAKSTEPFDYKDFGIENATAQAEMRYNEALSLSAQGDTKNTLEKLKQAHEAAPNWVFPVYDMAYAYLVQEDYENALKYYQLTDHLAPKGFYNTKIALYALEREIADDAQKGVFKEYSTIELIENATLKKMVITNLIEKFPTFAPVWNDYALLFQDTARLNAVEQGLALDPDVETKGRLLINKALVMNENGDFEKASKVLMGVIFDPQSTTSNIEMSKFYLNSMMND